MTDTTNNDEPSASRLPAPFEHIEIEYPYEWPGFTDPVSTMDTRFGTGRLLEAGYLRAIVAAIEPTTPAREQIAATMRAAVEDEGLIDYEESNRAAGAAAVEAAVLALFSQPSPSTPSVEHWKCDCVPNLGPAHCHACSDEAGQEVPWEEGHPSAEPVRVEDMAPGDVEDAALVDRVAAAIFEVRDDADDLRDWDEVDGDERERYQCDARAALAALNSNVTPPPALPEDGR